MNHTDILLPGAAACLHLEIEYDLGVIWLASARKLRQTHDELEGRNGSSAELLELSRWLRERTLESAIRYALEQLLVVVKSEQGPAH